MSERDNILAAEFVSGLLGPTERIEAEQRVDHAVLGAAHAPQLRLERRKARTEGDEHQAGAVALVPRHRTAQYEGLGREVLLRGALDVRRGRGVVELLVVRQAAADRVMADELSARASAPSHERML